MIHSSAEKDYKSVNTITFDAIKQAAALFRKATELRNRREGKVKADVFYKGKTYHISFPHKNSDHCLPEEYFRCKKQIYQFENFSVRKLEAINALNFYITLVMVFLVQEELSPETNALKVSIIQEADPIKDKVSFCYYRLAKGIFGMLSYAKEGIRLWSITKRPAYHQLCLNLTI